MDKLRAFSQGAGAAASPQVVPTWPSSIPIDICLMGNAVVPIGVKAGHSR